MYLRGDEIVNDAQNALVHAHVGGQAGDDGGVGNADGDSALQGGGGDGGDVDGVGAVHGQIGDVHLVGAAALHGGGVHLGVVDEQPQAGDAGGQRDVQLALIGVAVKAVQAVHGQDIVHIPGPVGECDLVLPALLGGRVVSVTAPDEAPAAPELPPAAAGAASEKVSAAERISPVAFLSMFLIKIPPHPCTLVQHA